MRVYTRKHMRMRRNNPVPPRRAVAFCARATCAIRIGGARGKIRMGPGPGDTFVRAAGISNVGSTNQISVTGKEYVNVTWPDGRE